MPATTVRGAQVRDGAIQRVDLDVSTPGAAVIAKAVQGQGIAITATGADAGTGDVTFALSHAYYTGYTGSGATNLDGEATVNLAVNNNFRWVVVSLSLSIWQLVAGSDVENVSAGIVRPDDWNGSTNAKVWKRVLGF
jgi:hypothetical protein